MTDLTPYFAGILEALCRPVAKAQHHLPKGSSGPDGKHIGGQFAAGWNLDPSQTVPVIQIREDVAGACPTWREATTWAKAHLRGTYQNQATGWDMTVGSNGIAEGIHRLAAAGHPEAIAAIPELIAHALPIHTGPDLLGRKHIQRVHTLIGAISIQGIPHRATLTIWDTPEGHGYHGHQIEHVDIEIPGDLGEGTGGQGPLSESHPPGTLSLGQLIHGFKAHTGENR
jgi:hypothetical protein